METLNGPGTENNISVPGLRLKYKIIEKELSENY